MEPVGAISEGAWNSFNGLCSEEADFMAQLLGNCSLPQEVSNSSGIAFFSNFLPVHESNMSIAGVDDSAMYSSDETNTNLYSLSQGSSYSGASSVLFPSSNHESYFHVASNQVFSSNNDMMMDLYMLESKNNGSRICVVMEGDDFLNQDISNDSMESNGSMPEDVLPVKDLQLAGVRETPVLETTKEDRSGSPSELSKKRPRLPVDAPRSKRGMKLKKSLNIDDNGEENDNNDAEIHLPASGSYSSEDDSGVSQELNGVTSSSCSKGSSLNLNGKTRAGRGSATDPQSLYARKRRERINERLRILQNLVPNGTKVDISTMLEEAVQYVKFLQLQIKLLSSDDLWMYAPIACNGMEIGLDLTISTPKSKSS